VALTLSSLPIVFGFSAYQHGYWLPMVVTEVALVLSYIAALTARYILEGRQKRYIKSAFAQYLSPIYIDELIRNPERLKLGGERRTLSIFFSDLQGFSSFAEKIPPEDLTHFLNHYLSAMTEIIHDEGGTVDKYEGDAIIAFWNAPLDIPDHATKAVRAALRCQEKLADMQSELRQWVETEVVMRIGINTGKAVVGNMGSSDRFDYTMLGDAVNLAARLEGVNKQFGSTTLISESTAQALDKGIPLRAVATVTVFGRTEAVRIFEPLNSEVSAQRADDLTCFASGLEGFTLGDFAAAKSFFNQSAERDPVAQAYLKRCGQLLEESPAQWRGIWEVTEK
ncbi:MAG: adenylate/guanylate cyclase domain-containing protein, partial [Desulfuromonadales bacterium]|nr:adenylate/guanylate cyclase domain-containing protein [Desulfuromonadales bacterium]